ncbi:MAG: chemotaxis protein CheW [Marinilabiliaceae bacterium]|nr:chemotaxis protein CheW [Marinilabiliaceae bacterium]
MEEETINAYLTFQVGECVFGVNVANVVEILEYNEPKARQANLPYLKGLIEHREVVIPLIDTGLKFGMPPVNVSNQICTIVLAVNAGQSDEFDVAVVVDKVSDIIEVSEENRQQITSTYKPGYVDFAAHGADEQLVLMLNVDKVFSDTDIVELKKIIKE